MTNYERYLAVPPFPPPPILPFPTSNVFHCSNLEAHTVFFLGKASRGIRCVSMFVRCGPPNGMIPTTSNLSLRLWPEIKFIYLYI